MIKDYPFLVPANSAVRPKITGNYIHLVESNASTQPLRVRAHSRSSGQVADINMVKGDNMHLDEFIRLEIDNPTGSDITVTMVIGDGVDFESGAGTSSVEVLPNSSAGGLTPLTFAVAGNQTIAENLARKTIDLMAAVNNSGLIYVGSTDGTKGIPLSGGGTYSLDITGAIEIYGDTIGDKLHIVEIS